MAILPRFLRPYRRGSSSQGCRDAGSECVCVQAMKTLQDRFGALCDGFVAAAELAAAVEAAGAEQARRRLDQRLGGVRAAARAADPLPGLRAFAARRQRSNLRDYASIHRHYLVSHGEIVLRPVERLAAALRRAPHDATIAS